MQSPCSVCMYLLGICWYLLGMCLYLLGTFSLPPSLKNLHRLGLQALSGAHHTHLLHAAPHTLSASSSL